MILTPILQDLGIGEGYSAVSYQHQQYVAARSLPPMIAHKVEGFRDDNDAEQIRDWANLNKHIIGNPHEGREYADDEFTLGAGEDGEDDKNATKLKAQGFFALWDFLNCLFILKQNQCLSCTLILERSSDSSWNWNNNYSIWKIFTTQTIEFQQTLYMQKSFHRQVLHVWQDCSAFLIKKT